MDLVDPPCRITGVIPGTDHVDPVDPPCRITGVIPGTDQMDAGLVLGITGPHTVDRFLKHRFGFFHDVQEIRRAIRARQAHVKPILICHVYS
jgi:hypothetical protein